jgi:hypothetical protein
MERSSPIQHATSVGAALLALYCAPIHDLDGASSGGGSGDSDGNLSGSHGGGTADAAPNDGVAQTDGSMPSDGGDAGATADAGEDATGAGGQPPDAPDTSLSPEVANPSLIPSAPDQRVAVTSKRVAIGDAMVDTFEIETPMANYRYLKQAGALASIVDPNSEAHTDWVQLGSNVPTRGVPNLGLCCDSSDPEALSQPRMITVEDEAKRSLYRVRLISESEDGSWRLRWDFFISHATLRVERAPGAFGFSYRGVPGGSIDLGSPGDTWVTAAGSVYAIDASLHEDLEGYVAKSPWSEFWSGPAKWVYFSDSSVGRSLFVVSHADDTLKDYYQLVDGETAAFQFGSQLQSVTPANFSLGLVNSVIYQDIEDWVGQAVAIDP